MADTGKPVGILAALVGPKRPAKGGGDADDSGSSGLSAADALIEAVNSGDKAGVLSAFELLYRHCKGEKPKEGEEY